MADSSFISFWDRPFLDEGCVAVGATQAWHPRLPVHIAHQRQNDPLKTIAESGLLTTGDTEARTC